MDATTIAAPAHPIIDPALVSMIPRIRTEVTDTSQPDDVLVLLPRITTPLHAATMIALKIPT